ncbi:helix-turn-helix domain-containing protein [Streptomyces sp. H10-C2]|nr:MULTISPECIES: helix-turn-helix domain-containing protein [unclassified Streptomyces]MDJ0340956.1 helix-turn-helix domain-containing protein [Streptomyces sp. PH10-H1]MDJ0369812.1 helix-turn-helix domain-containing protein [Streptomyces sp. H10-C2]
MCELLNRIWSLPRGEWTRVLRKELPSLADQMVEVLRHEIPGFADLLEDMGREMVRQGLEEALLTALGYRKPEKDGDRDQVPPATPAPLDRARQDLFQALTGGAAVSAASLPELARQAGWPLPETVRAVALATPGETQQLAAALEGCLVGMGADGPCLLIPSSDPDTRGALEAALRGRSAAAGHAVPLRDAGSSLRWARRLLNLTPASVGPDARVVFVDDHLSTLLLLQDEPLAKALAARWLRPLAGLTPRQSERLEVTLLAWLEGGGAPEAAKALNVHPQTVRYRMRQLEKLFGQGLRDPRTRFELEMALRSRRLMAQIGLRHSRVTRRARTVTAGFRPLVVAREARVNGL